MEECKMRLTLFILAVVASSQAAAQSWKEYSYPDYAFTVSFPAEPAIESKTEAAILPAGDGRAMPARVYSAAQNNAVFKMTVVELSSAGLEESAVIDQA